MRRTEAAAMRQVLLAADARFTALVNLAQLDPARDFVAAKLDKIVVFPEENLSGFDFSYASLVDAQLCGVDLRGVRFEHTDLSGADLRGTQYTPDQFLLANLENARFGKWAEAPTSDAQPIECSPLDRAVQDAFRLAAGDVQRLITIGYRHWLTGESYVAELIGAAAEQWALEEAGADSLPHLRAMRVKFLASFSLGYQFEAIQGLQDISDRAAKQLEPEASLEMRCDLGNLVLDVSAEESDLDLKQLVDDAERFLGPRHLLTIRARHLSARAEYRRGNFVEAAALLQSLIPTSVGVIGADHAETLGIRCSLGLAYLGLDRIVEADAEAIRVSELLPPSGDWLPLYAANLERLRAEVEKGMATAAVSPSAARQLNIAIIGSGPAGFYTAEACQKAFDDGCRVDVIDRLPVPYGLIRYGVAPDHQSMKSVSRRYEAVALSDNVRFVGNVSIGRDVGIGELRELYDAVVLATGAPVDRPLGVPGEDLVGVVGSAPFVGWYNGHPDFADLAPPLHGPGAVIIGNGNVALDVARILAKNEEEFEGSDIVAHALTALRTAEIETITILGRRGPHQIAMTPKELGELGHLARAVPVVDPADLPHEADDATLEPGVRKSVIHLREFAQNRTSKPIRLIFDFFAMPVRIEGDGHAERVIVERTALDAEGRATGTGETYAVPASLVVSCVGFRTPPIEGVPYDERAGRFASEEGRIARGLYAVGWARRGPTGTIGTNRPDGYAIVEKIGEDFPIGSGKAGRQGLDALLASRNVEVVTFQDWQKIEAAEVSAARKGSPREKITRLDAMLDARNGQ